MKKNVIRSFAILGEPELICQIRYPKNLDPSVDCCSFFPECMQDFSLGGLRFGTRSFPSSLMSISFRLCQIRYNGDSKKFHYFP